MEELQSLMACLDDISSKIGDGMYLDMADKMKRIHDKLNGNKPFHEDSFYYSSDNEDSNSDDDSGYDSDYNERARRQVAIQLIRDHLLDYVRSMHQTWAQLQGWEKEVKKVIPLIKRMTAARKQRAIRRWCERSRGWRPGGTAGDLIGCGPIVTGSIFWSWKNLMENGLHAIVMEIGTEEEIEKAKRGFVDYDDLSLATLRKLPVFEKKIYDDYQYGYNEEILKNRREANAKVREHEEFMQRWEMRAREEENKLRELGARVYDRDRWDAEAHDFWVDDVNGRLVNGP
tara:strand:+ start:2866 stop:3726 length:861 start_codon:yes stop_codon:yes gene_type:complete